MFEAYDIVLSVLAAVPLAVASLFAAVPMLWRLVGGKQHPENKNVTSDIPGNPHCFDFSLISLLRTMPEPNNFNIVWTKVPLDEPLLVRGQLPPGRFSSYSVYPGIGAVPESMELHAKDTERMFEITLQRPDGDHPVTQGDVLVVPDAQAPVGMLVMRNYLVPPGTMVRTPELIRKRDGAVVRASEQLIAGAATIHLQAPFIWSALKQIALMHAVLWGMVVALRGLGPCAVHFSALVSVIAGLLTVGLYQLLYVIGKKRMNTLGKELAPEANKLYLCDLERSSKGSQPSKIHKYYIMQYDIPKGSELAVIGKIDKARQEYWSLVAYDIHGIPLPQFFYDLNASKTAVSEDVYEYDIRMTNASNIGALPRKGLSELDVSAASKGFVLFRLVHPRDDEVTTFSQPVTALVKVDGKKEK